MDDLFPKDGSWSPYEEMQRMQIKMDQLFGDSFSRLCLNAPLGVFTKLPEVDLQETPNIYIVTVNAPGVDKSSMTVILEGRQLSIAMKSEHVEDKADQGEYKYRERFMGQYQRVLKLPGQASAAKIKTDYHNGVLTITIPKA